MKKKIYKISYFDRRIKTPVKNTLFLSYIKHFNEATIKKNKDNNKPKRITVIPF